MNKYCDICYKEVPKYVLRFYVGDNLYYELDTCINCRIVLDKYKHLYKYNHLYIEEDRI